MKAHIITVGDEILIGQVVDTNSAWMGSELNQNGIQIMRITSVSDQHQDIINAIDDSLENADIVFMTGGLGPTKDDITKKAIADFFGVNMVYNEETFQHISAFFTKIGKELNPAHIAQCDMPENAILLVNKMGTAPGMWFEHNGKILVSMPGVPYEMKYLMTNEVLPRLKANYKGKPIAHRTILTVGEGESVIADRINDIEEKLPSFIKLAFLPAISQVRLRLTGVHEDEVFLNKVLDEKKEEIRLRLQDIIFGYDDSTLQEEIGKIMVARNMTLGTAESCTGGFVAHTFTSVVGASAYYQGSIVAYDNRLKIEKLQVKPETLEEYGAVSEQVVTEMAMNAVSVLGVSVAISISGIAGPTGGTPEKPVGTIWMAVSDGNETTTQLIKGGKDRIRNIEYAGVQAMNLLRKFLIAR